MNDPAILNYEAISETTTRINNNLQHGNIGRALEEAEKLTKYLSDRKESATYILASYIGEAMKNINGISPNVNDRAKEIAEKCAKKAIYGTLIGVKIYH